MAKQSIFKKAASMFVQNDEDQSISDQELLDSLDIDYTNLVVKIPDTSDSIVSIEEIYNDNGLGVMSTSIYKVDEIKSALPDNITSAAKKSSVEGMITVSGLNKEQLISDANDRINILTATSKQLSCVSDNEIENLKNAIKEYEQYIQESTDKYMNLQVVQEKQTDLINEEIEVIQSIVDFIK